RRKCAERVWAACLVPMPAVPARLGSAASRGQRHGFARHRTRRLKGGAASLLQDGCAKGTGCKAQTEGIIHPKARGLVLAEPSGTSPSGVVGREPPPRQSQEYSVDTSALSTGYVNFCRITGTPEELIIDIGLNTQMNPVPSSEPIRLTHRLVMNFYT